MTNHDAALELTDIVFPEHANHYGTLFGGNALLLMSKAAFLAARAFAGSDVVMARCGDARFLAPVPVGSVLRLRAWVSRVGRSSLTVRVDGTAQQPGREPRPVLESLRQPLEDGVVSVARVGGTRSSPHGSGSSRR